jgi:hypothetical protein
VKQLQFKILVTISQCLLPDCYTIFVPRFSPPFCFDIGMKERVQGSGEEREERGVGGWEMGGVGDRVGGGRREEWEDGR